MNNLNPFLSVFENLIKSEIGSKKIIEEVFEDVLGIKINSEKINLEEFKVNLDVHPVIKNEVILNQEELILKLKKRAGKKFDSIF